MRSPSIEVFLLVIIIFSCVVQDADAWWRRRRRRRRSPPPPPPPDTTAPTFSSCPGNIGSQYTTSTSRMVTWTTPTARDNRGSVTVMRISGSDPGSVFTEGSHTVQYRATDSSGNSATCTVSFVVRVIRCSTLWSPSNGDVHCTDNSYVGSTCIYSCSTGFQLNGESTSRTCTRSGNSGYWNGSSPSCDRVQCTILQRPSRGSLICTDGNYYNSSCTFSCDHAYTLQPASSTWTCLQSGSWSNSGTGPTCIDIGAPSFTFCPASQTVFAADLLTRANATWSSPTASDNSGEKINLTMTHGSAPGSLFDEGAHHISYQAVDSAGNEAFCTFQISVKVIRCSTQIVASPLQVHCPNGNIRGSVCSFSCMTGHILEGQASNECEKNGTSGSWTRDVPSCEILQCLDPQSLLDDHTHIVEGSCHRLYGTTCRFACEEGYKITNNELACTAQPEDPTAFWEGIEPACSRIQCTKPLLDPALHIVQTSECPAGDLVSSGNQCEFVCPDGHYLQGHAVLTCRNDETWDNEVPTCHDITCLLSHLQVPIHGTLQGCTKSREDYGTTCSIACDVGYLPEPPAPRTCVDDRNGDVNGVWSGSNWTCIIVTCPALLPPMSGTVTSCSREGQSTDIAMRQSYGTSCTLGCDPGFTMTGSGIRTCTANGEWHGTSPLCTDITVPTLICPSDKEFFAESQSTSVIVPWSDWEPLLAQDRGSTLPAALYSIDYSEVGSAEPVDLEEGTHTLVYTATDEAQNTGRCTFTIHVKVTRCPPIWMPHNAYGVGACTSASIYGSICRLMCDTGYTFSSNDDEVIHTCDRATNTDWSGYWTGQNPTCQIVNCTLPSPVNWNSQECVSTTVQYGTSCHFFCNDGYKTPSGIRSITRICQANATWNGDDFHCTDIETCPASFSVSNGRVFPSQCSDSPRVPFGTTCSFTCNIGYQLDGINQAVCNTNGEWNQIGVPSCRDIQPPSFERICPYVVPANASRGSKSALVQYEDPVAQDNSGSVIVVRVRGELPWDNVFLEGRTELEYEATDGSGLSARCDVIVSVHVFRCTAHTPMTHGTVQGCDDPIYGSECTFSCDDGYDLIGGSTSSCGMSPNGITEWTPSQPFCQARMCPLLVIPPDAILSGCDGTQMYPFGTVCSYNCPQGFQGVGDSRVICRADGTWSSTFFSCQRLSCLPLTETSDVAITPEKCLTNPQYEDICQLSCKYSGFAVLPSDLTVTICSASQTWSTNTGESQCIDTEAPTIDTCPSGIMVYADIGSNEAQVSWTIVARDNSGFIPSVTCTPEQGIIPVGHHRVHCIAADGAGNEITCNFDLDVNIRTCGELRLPSHGTVVESCDSGIGSICQITCLEGYSLTGSSSARCEFNGTDMFWDFETTPQCKESGCIPLVIPVNNLRVTPESCVTAVRVHSMTDCFMSCTDDLSLVGDNQPITCTSSGDWSRTLDVESLQCLDKVHPRLTYCPNNPIAATRTEVWGVEVSFEPPRAEDNYDLDLQITTIPPNLKSPFNFTSDVICVYTFTDDAQNNVSCAFEVNIANEVTPEITYCPEDQNITTNSQLTDVYWENVTYRGIPGIDFVVTCTTDGNHATLPLGTHLIVCYVTDPTSGLQAQCKINIVIRAVACTPLNSPQNGALVCDNFASSRYCSIFCNDEHDIARIQEYKVQTLYVCGFSGQWVPGNRAPDCSRARRPKRINLPLEIMYYEGQCDLHEDLQAIKEVFMGIFEDSNFGEICFTGHTCSSENVDVNCGPSTRQKRSSITYDESDNKEMDFSFDDKNGNVTIVSMVVQMTSNNQTVMTNQKHSEALDDMAKHMELHFRDILLHFRSVKGDEVSSVPAEKPKVLVESPNIHCPLGYVHGYNRLACVACPRGHFFHKKKKQCMPCNMGYYQDKEAQTECQPCGKGRWTRASGARSESQCEVPCSEGSYSPTGFSPCVWCEPGTYQPARGQMDCIVCLAGLTTFSYGSMTVDDCKEPCQPGYTSKSGLQPCLPCPFGFYQPLTQRTACRKCKGDATTRSTGAKSIKECYNEG